MHRFFIRVFAAMVVLSMTPAVLADEPKKRLALTFDDAPRGDGPMFSGEERGQVFLEVLEKAETGPVLFFVTTRGFEKPEGRERINAYAAAGHLIANHSHTHQWASRVETDDYIADIDEAARWLDGVQNRRDWYRFPFLDEGRPVEKRDAYRAALEERGLKNGYVTIDNYDWYLEGQWKKAVTDGRSVDLDALQAVYVKMMVEAANFYEEAGQELFGRSVAHTLLLHENDVGALFVDDLVAALRADGWDIISPDEAYADPIASMTTETLFNNQGHLAALAVDAGRSPRSFDHWSIDEAQIDAVLEEYGVFGPGAE